MRVMLLECNGKPAAIPRCLECGQRIDHTNYQDENNTSFCESACERRYERFERADALLDRHRDGER